MEELVTKLTETAQIERMVVSEALGDHTRVMVYPLPGFAIVAIGRDYGLDWMEMAEAVLRRRSGNLARYGAWLPVLIEGGALYVARRVEGPLGNGMNARLSAAELDVAMELMA